MTSDYYESIVYNHDFQKDIITSALEIVKKYIQRKRLILVGGMAIDMALRTKGDALYKDNKLPDYDFYSYEHHRDAYDLGIILAKQFDGVSIINAFHVSTMRIRINFQEVADITYIPKSIIDELPVMEYMGFRFIHPHFQVIDQHRALSLPFEMPPFETIFNRWKKDIVRYDILMKHLPLTEMPAIDGIATLHSSSIKNGSSTLSIGTKNKYSIPINILTNRCISGYAALAYWIKMAESDGYKCINDTWNCSFNDASKNITCSLPEQAHFCVLADDYDKAIKQVSTMLNVTDSKSYYPVLDKIPARTELSNKTGKYVIINNYGDKRSAYLEPSDRYYISNLQEVMCYLLTNGIVLNHPIALSGYIIAREILLFASSKYTGTDDKYSKYLPTIDTFGSANIYMAYVVSKQRLDTQFNKIKQTLIQPRNAYPKKDNPSIKDELYEFDPTNEQLFQFDGSLLPSSV